MPDIGIGPAAAVLGLNRPQVMKLAACGLLRASRTPGGQQRFAVAEVTALASWPPLTNPVPGGIAFHVRPLERDHALVQPRRFSGFAEGAVATGLLSQRDEDDAWRGFWNCDPGYTIGVVSVSGFLVRAARLRGVSGRRGTKLQFDLAPLPARVRRSIVGHRIVVGPGPVFTPLS